MTIDGLSFNIWVNIVSHLTTEEACTLKRSSQSLYSLFSDKAFVQPAVEGNWQLLILASKELKQDPGLKEIAFGNNLAPPTTFQILFFMKDKDYALSAVKDNPISYGMVPLSMRADREVALAAVTGNPMLFTLVPDELLRDALFLIDLFTKTPWLDNPFFRTFSTHKQTLLANLASNGLMLIFASDQLKDDLEVVRTAVNQNPKAIQFASDRIHSTPSLLQESEEA